jgi:hypothetical protein
MRREHPLPCLNFLSRHPNIRLPHRRAGQVAGRDVVADAQKGIGRNQTRSGHFCASADPLLSEAKRKFQACRHRGRLRTGSVGHERPHTGSKVALAGTVLARVPPEDRTALAPLRCEQTTTVSLATPFCARSCSTRRGKLRG